MSEPDYRIEKDSLGEVRVPAHALYGAQTQRAVDNFPISDLTMPRAFIRALGLVKAACAMVNLERGLLDVPRGEAIRDAAMAVSRGEYDAHFPVDVFQTGSGTSSNMNANEVIAAVARLHGPAQIHPNDHVNMGQSSNDVIPTCIHLSAALMIAERLLPALEHLARVTEVRATELKSVVKTGRTHLMDAMPVTLGQELGGWAAAIHYAIARISSSLPRLRELAIGGTAVGTGVNAPEGFGAQVVDCLTTMTRAPLTPKPNYFEALSGQDAAVEMSGQLRTLAVSLTKIANDLRWMNSGPLSGLGEIRLVALQPGSSIMPGKVNPVIPEAVTMACAQVLGNDTTIAVAGQSGNFQLNVMLPVIAYNLLQSIELLTNASLLLASKAIESFQVDTRALERALDLNPILVTALNRVIGYEQGAAIAKRAYVERRPVLEVAVEMTDLDEAELRRLLDPRRLTEGDDR